MIQIFKKKIKNILIKIIKQLYQYILNRNELDFILSMIKLNKPLFKKYGDFTCNISMKIANILKIDSFFISKQLANILFFVLKKKKIINSLEVFKPGFINFFLLHSLKYSIIDIILNERDKFGYVKEKKNKILVEFVSANPTGFLHIGHGYQAILGNVISNLLLSQGYVVYREFYYNNIGTQIDHIVESVQARALGFKPGDMEWPNNSYNGKYITDIAISYLDCKSILCNGVEIKSNGDIFDMNLIKKFSIAYLTNEQNIDLNLLNVKFDNYFLESSLYKNGIVDRIIDKLILNNKTYIKDGALWLSSSTDNDSKDRVIRKSDGTYTYFVSDLAYHVTKWNRGFKKAINIHGSDHHGLISRIRFGLKYLSIGIPDNYPRYILHKMITVLFNGKKMKVSKRLGNYITLRDLILLSGNIPIKYNGFLEFVDKEHIQRGCDALKFFFISRKIGTDFVFDVDIAIEQNQKNPIYYVQYAYVRINNIIRNWKIKFNTNCSYIYSKKIDFTVLNTVKSINLLKKLNEFPEILRYATKKLAPHIIIFYLRDFAHCIHLFYNTEHILTKKKSIRNAYIALCISIRHVLLNCFNIIGISVINKM